MSDNVEHSDIPIIRPCPNWQKRLSPRISFPERIRPGPPTSERILYSELEADRDASDQVGNAVFCRGSCGRGHRWCKLFPSQGKARPIFAAAMAGASSAVSDSYAEVPNRVLRRSIQSAM